MKGGGDNDGSSSSDLKMQKKLYEMRDRHHKE
jgi:hypothetical protein